MFDAYIMACYLAKIDPEITSQGTKRVVQTIGNAPDSKGFHAKDGEVVVKGVTIPYCAAVDLSVRGLTAGQIKKWLAELAKQGFAAWYRFEGVFANNRHVHAVYVGVQMKKHLQSQVQDFLRDKNGLASHAGETFYVAPVDVDKPLAQMFVRANPSQRTKVPQELLT